MAAPAVAQSDIARITVIATSDHAAPLSDIARGVQYALQQAWPELVVEITDKENFIPKATQSTLIVALGDALLPWLTEHSHDYSSAIAFYVSATAFAPHDKNSAKLTALYRDQPLVRQLDLAKLLIPNLHHAAILRGKNPLPQSVPELQRSSGIVITEASASQQSEWPKLLAQVIRDNDVLLGIDDPSLYNGETIRSILLTTYRHGKSVIGPSRAFVTAGSLASCYTASDQYLQQLLTMVATSIQNHKPPRPQYPKQFRVVVNPQVATSLGLTIPTEETLTAWSQNYSGDCGNGC
jgi:ABC-type uncharacterized transport system substrate-binding protein